MNRHDVYIWDANEAELLKDFTSLLKNGAIYAELEDKPSANLLAFAEALKQHETQVDYGDSFFRRSAHAVKNSNTKAVMIEIPEGAWQRPLRDIVKLAQDYNLIVADEEVAMVFLPTGKIMPYGAEDEWHALLGELAEEDDLRLAYKKTKLPTTEYEYTLWVRPILSKRLEKYGFKLVKTRDNRTNDLYDSWYCREVECGQQYIEFRHAGEAPYFRSGVLSFYMICPVISDIYYKFGFDQEPKVFSSSLGAYKNIIIENPIPLSEEQEQSDIDDVVRYIIEPILDKTKTIIGVDNFVNGWLSKQPLSYVDTIKKPLPSNSRSERTYLTPDSFKGMGTYSPQQLIVARLANNPHYEKLRNFFEADKIFNIAPYNKELVTEWPKLVEYLCEDINPDTFWQQYALLKEAERRLEEDRVQQFITQFKLNPDEELIPVSDQWYDSQTNLIWQRCCMGEHWQDAQLTGKAELMSWDEKEAYLERFKDTGWRLPTKQELEGLAISKKVGYITKVGFNFYDQIEKKLLSIGSNHINLFYPIIKKSV